MKVKPNNPLSFTKGGGGDQGRMEMKRILVTGGAGFLGSHLCDHFIALGYEVICMDNLVKKENIENITHLLGHDRFKFIKYDVTEYLYVEGKLDDILHFASLASPKDYLDYPIQTLKVGSLGTAVPAGLDF
jgi:dTDP-glucose 4,6-dehydratase